MKPESPLRTWQGRTVRGPHETESTVAQRVGEQLTTLGNRLNGSLFFVPSPLEGWGLDVLAARLGTGSVVVCFEKNSELDLAFHKLAVDRFQTNLDKLFWLSSDTEESVRELCRVLPLQGLRRVEWFPVSGGWLLASTRYREICARLDREIRTFWSNRMTSMHLGPLWVKNLFDNLANHDVSAPWPDWNDEDVVVCGAGTSLEDWLPSLRQSQGKVHIVAADTALPGLIGAGVTPEAVVCLESQHVNLRDFLPASGKPIALFCDLSAHPATTRALLGQHYWFCTPFGNLAIWERILSDSSIVTLPPLGSVGVAAVAVAHRLTRGRVFLVGLDFCWPQGKTHSRGSPAIDGLVTQGTRLRGFEQPANWLRDGTMEASEPGWLTTRVLQSYSEVLRDHVSAQEHRTWMLGDKGLDVGLKRLHEWPQRLSRGEALDPKVPVTDGRTWPLDQEILRLERVIRELEELNRKPHGPSEWEQLSHLLVEVDYLYFSFPDPQLRLDSSFLSRFLILARWMRERLIVVAGLEHR